MHRSITLAALVILAALSSAQADDKLADQLKQLDAQVAAGDDAKALANMLGDAIRTRRYELSDRDTAAWNKVKNRADWEGFRRPRLQALAQALGDFPAPPKKLNVHIVGTVKGEGFVVDKVLFESRPGLWVSANLYRPAKPSESMPGILICHSHHRPKDNGELQDMGMTWARAGCLVLIPDQLGHGERGQHPFRSSNAFAKPFRLSRQDYHFRFDSGVQFHLLGDSLMGWMVYDLRRCVDLLLAQKGVDAKRIILLGSVAGGGDPAAVAAALDDRIACVAPFNFGAPGPRPLYPYDLAKPPHWNFVGGGSWESTRNLRDNAVGGFVPWFLVAAAAPRRLVYAHEFGWFKEGDPTWQRLQKIYSFHDNLDGLSFTHGKGDVTKRPPEATHCNHIGAVHRRMMHPAFERWFKIDMTADKEYSQRLETQELRCWTPELKEKLHPPTLMKLMNDVAARRMESARKARAGKPPAEQRRLLQEGYRRLLRNVEPTAKVKATAASSSKVGNVKVERLLLNIEPGIVVPVVLLVPEASSKKTPVTVVVSAAGKEKLLKERSTEIAALLAGGSAVCLPDVRGTGETAVGSGRDYRSSSTGLSASQLMLGEPLVAGQLRDLRAVLKWLRSRKEIDSGKIALWGDSLAKVNAADTNFKRPRDRTIEMPHQPEPLGGLLALLGALYEDDIDAVYVRNGLAEFRGVLDSHLVLIPHDVVVPGLLETGDLSDLVAVLAPKPVRLDGLVDALDRRVDDQRARKIYEPALQAYARSKQPERLAITDEAGSSAQWLLRRLAEASK